MAAKVVPGTVAEGQTAQGSINRNKVEESDEVGAIAAEKADGTYYGSGEGFKSQVTVAVTVKDGKVTAIEVVSQADDQSYFSHAEEVAAKVTEYQRLDVNTMAGATYSSKGILAAVENALGPNAYVPVTSKAWFRWGIIGLVGALLIAAGFCAIKARQAKKPALRIRWAAWQRYATQFAFFVVAPSVFASALSGGKYFFQTIYEADMDGVSPEFAINSLVIVLIALLVFTVVFGRLFCGHACSFGLFEDLLYGARKLVCAKLPIKERAKKVEPSKTARLLDRGLRCLKYLVLIGIMYLIYMGYAETVSDASPWVAFAQLSSFSTRRLTIAGVILLALVAVGSACIERFFCRYLCPMGAIFSILPTLPWARVRRRREQCLKGCDRCGQACPCGVHPDARIVAGECISCDRCASACPIGNANYELAAKLDAICGKDPAQTIAESAGPSAEAANTGHANKVAPAPYKVRKGTESRRPLVIFVLCLLLLLVLWLVGATQYLPQPAYL